MFRTFLDNDFMLTPSSEQKVSPARQESGTTQILMKDWEQIECEESGTIFYKHKTTQKISWEYPIKSTP